jgi:hypothetical protein
VNTSVHSDDGAVATITAVGSMPAKVWSPWLT